MSSNSIYNLPYTYLIGWSSLDLYYYGRRTAMDCHPSDLFESYFTSSTEVEHYVSEYGIPDIIQVRKTFDNNDDCCEWECKVLRRLDAKNNPRLLNKTNGDSEWIYSGIDAIWMNRNGNNRRVRREHIGHYKDMGWVEGRAVDWIWIKKDNESKRVSDDVIGSYLEDGWERGRAIDLSKEKNPAYGKYGKDSCVFKGYWYTPHGIFESLRECTKNSPIRIAESRIHSMCKNNETVITNAIYSKTKYIKYFFERNQAVGKTTKELGFKHE